MMTLRVVIRFLGVTADDFPTMYAVADIREQRRQFIEIHEEPQVGIEGPLFIRLPRILQHNLSF